MDIRMSMSDLQRMEFKQAFEEFDKVISILLLFSTRVGERKRIRTLVLM